MKLQKYALTSALILLGISLKSQADTTLCGSKESGTSFEIVNFESIQSFRASTTEYFNGKFVGTQRAAPISMGSFQKYGLKIEGTAVKKISEAGFYAGAIYLMVDGTQVWATWNSTGERTIILSKERNFQQIPKTDIHLSCKIL